MAERKTEAYFRMLREMRDVVFSTVAEDGTPRARIIDVMLVEGEKLYFLTAAGKDFYEELMRTSRVAIAGLNSSWETVRVWGRVRNVGQDLLGRIFEENPVMNGVYPGESRYILEPFCIESGELEFFDLGKSPIYRESFVFGSAEASREAPQNTGKEAQICHAPREKGFLITDVCIGCGKCMRGCPQQCITKGIPFRIHQEHCLHCGLCFENCPVQAIVRRGA